jgi:drug/metabolite transporter (DMT)-like permease
LLGSRLTVLITQCLAAPIAMVAEWLWLGTTLRPSQIGCSFVILAGVTIALLPSRADPPKVQVKAAGLIFGLLAAAGQGLGAVVSRKASALAAGAGESVDGITWAYQRILGGLAITLVYFAVRGLLAHRTAAATPTPTRTWRDYGWIPANSLCGAVIGVSCYQWALATTESGIVLPIVATTPLVIVPLSYWLEGERPTRRSVVGGIVAVAGVVALRLVR